MAVRIGINALYMIPGGVGGTEIYLRNLLRGFAEVDTENEYYVLTNRETGADLVPALPNFNYCPQPVPARFRTLRLMWEQAALPWTASNLKLDRMLNPGFTAPIFLRCPTVTVFHDLQHMRHPEYFRWFDLPFWRMFLYGSAKCSSLLVAVSDATRRDLLEYYDLPPEKVLVVPHGVEGEFFEVAKRRETAEPMILCVSTLHPHKNLDRLVRAFAAFRARHPRYKLVITGLRGFHTRQVERQIAEAELNGSVELTGWIPRQELYELYRRAALFVYPSRFEGFGMPVLEAMAAGVPLACSAIQPLKSLAEGAALLFDPDSEDAIANALERLEKDESLRCHLVRTGMDRAARYSWPETARRTLDALLQI